MNDILFSIVIPTYNRAKFIRNTIDSVLVQTYENFEVIVVDDGSTDGTGDIVRAIDDPRVTYYPKTNEERAAARNFGVKKAKGEFVNFLDSDDYLYPDHLSEARNFLLDQPDAKIFHMAFESRDDKGRVMNVFHNPASINDSIVISNTLSANAVVIQRQVLLDNPFIEDRRLASLEDWELWIRLASRFHIYGVNPVTSVVVMHDNRSVMSANSHRIQEKVDVFCDYVVKNEDNRTKYGPLLRRTTATAKTYAALHIAMTGTAKATAWRYLRKGIADSTSQLFTKRFLNTLLFLFGIRKLR